MSGKTILRLLCIAALVCFSACSRYEAIADQKDLQEKLIAAIENKPETSTPVIIRLKDLTTFEWDRFYVFGPYTRPDDVRKALGFNWYNANQSSVSVQDYDNFLVFVRNGKVVHYHDHPRKHGDFYPVKGRTGYTPEEAVFEVTMDRGLDWLVLRQIKTPTSFAAP